jgi:hypothetical protein
LLKPKPEAAMNTNETINYFGDRATLSKMIGISVQAIAQWPETVPLGRREAVRKAMKEHANQLEAQAKKLRRAAKGGEV